VGTSYPHSEKDRGPPSLPRWYPRRYISIRSTALFCTVFSLTVTFTTMEEKNDKIMTDGAAERDASGDENMVDDKPEGDFPEGGLRAWLVVSGSAAIMFCGFGYLTGFG
jgi:hypothetical protein